MDKTLKDFIIERNYFKNFDDILPNVELLPNETFIDLKLSMYPEILPIYKISNMNRIYNTISQKILSVKIKKNGNGYYSVKLRTYDSYPPYKTNRTYSMHRLLLASFNPIDGMEDLYVNHIDGNKSNNELSNLEWCTPSENLKHAYNLGLAKGLSGDDSPYSTISSKDVHRACEMYETSNFTIQEIADILGVRKSVIVNIVTGNSWVSISSQYDFSKREFRKPSTKFTADEIHSFCRFFQDNPRLDTESKRKYMIRAVKNTNYNNGVYDELLLSSLVLIYKRKSYKKISMKYEY